jgi:hypothetical protein
VEVHVGQHFNLGSSMKAANFSHSAEVGQPHAAVSGWPGIDHCVHLISDDTKITDSSYLLS